MTEPDVVGTYMRGWRAGVNRADARVPLDFAACAPAYRRGYDDGAEAERIAREAAQVLYAGGNRS